METIESGLITSSSTTNPASDQTQTAQICDQCQSEPFKYRCPACSIITCSLDCSKLHKLQKTYSWGSLMQDFSYLEDINRSLTKARGLTGEEPQIDQRRLEKSKKKTCKQLKLVKEASKLGVKLVLMSDGMTRRKLNQTTYNHQEASIRWSLEFIVYLTLEEINNSSCSDSGKKPQKFFFNQVGSDLTILSIFINQVLQSKRLKVTQPKKQLLIELTEKISMENTLNGDQPEKEEGMDRSVIKEGEKSLMFLLRLEVEELSGELTGCVEDQKINNSSKRFVKIIKPNLKLIDGLRGSRILEWPRIEVLEQSRFDQLVLDGTYVVLEESFTKVITDGQDTKHYKKIKIDTGEKSSTASKETSDSSSQGDYNDKEVDRSNSLIQHMLEYESSNDDES
ncbi:hypothetical protein PPACK8108_LOCUS11682 [Phakopsora pachyrhizi]|uniref:HIT-type domain-containing protein n=1 Tax=Phakopsora pachyrhizi TaxID=170000 RepID=A0AAV0B2Z9_PHAPC|nr:hypothetical protein PPACK8108_LOCUS11682 [Phakopsora pachyrhizi]